MSVTLKEIAERIGVAPSTVSKAINNRPGVSEQTRQIILAEIEAMGLKPKRRVGGLQRRKLGNIALLIHKSKAVYTDPFYSLVTEGIVKEAQHRGFHVIYFLMDNNDVDVDENLGELMEGNTFNGLILIGADLNTPFLDKIKTSQIPMVLVDSKYPGFNCIVTANVDGTKDAVKYLVENGHHNILFLCGPLNHNSIAERLEGYKAGLEQYAQDSKPLIICADGLGVDSGRKALESAEYDGAYTAILAANDKLAIGALKALKEKDLDVPCDISLIGFDDIEWALHTDPPLTTVRVAKRQTGMLAAKLLIQAIADTESHPAQIEVSTRLIVRQSSGPAAR
jgi:LacI family transcriptional regulator